MKLLFSFLKPQIVFGAGDGGGGSRGPSIKPTGFADQASRMANSQRQLGASQFPGFNLEDEKDVPSVVKRKPQRDSSPIDAGSGGFMGGFNKSPKSGSGNDGANPLTSGFGSRKEAGNTSQQAAQRSLDLSGSQQAAQRSLDLSGIGGVGGKTPSFGSQGTSKPVGLPRIPSVVADDFIPRNPDGSPKYAAPDGSPLRRPYDPSTPSRPTPRPGGGKGGGSIAPPPNMPRPDMPQPPSAPDLVGGGPPRKQPKTEFDPDRRPPRPRVIGDDFIPRNSDGSPKYTAPDGSPLRYPYDPSTPVSPAPRPGGGKGGGGIALPPNMPTPPFPDPRRRPPTAPIPDPRPRAPVFDNFPVTPFPEPLPRRPSVPAPPQPIREFGVPRQGGRFSVPMNDPVAQRPMPARRQPPVPYGGKGGGARPSMQQRRPQAPFTYYRPKR